MIIDYLHTENTDGHGCPQADSFFGEQQLTEMDREFKENNIYPQINTDGHRYPQADGRSERECPQIIREFKGIGPQADGESEHELFTHCQTKEEFIKLRKFSRIDRELKEIGPQADGGEEQLLMSD